MMGIELVPVQDLMWGLEALGRVAWAGTQV